MNLTPLKANMTELEIGDLTILFSYKTPVACHEAGVGYAKTEKFWSVTTSKHITQWLNLNGFNKERGDGLRLESQEYFDNLVKAVA